MSYSQKPLQQTPNVDKNKITHVLTLIIQFIDLNHFYLVDK